MRLIDADKLCEDLLERWSVADTRKEELIRQVMADIVTPIIASQPTIENKQNWTPCSKKMPNLSQEVLMSDEFDTVRAGSLEKYVDGDYYWEDSHGYLYDVEDWMAWMSLPKPYKSNRGGINN